MQYKGKELKTGSQYYAAAMDLMKHDTIAKCVRGAVELFICGAERNDRFCVARLKEFVNTPRYLTMLGTFESSDLIDALVRILRLEKAEREANMVNACCRPGMFGIMRPAPVNGLAGVEMSPKRARNRGL